MKIIFFGTGNYALPVIDELKKEFNITVFTTETEKHHPLIKYASDNNLSVVSFSSFKKDEIKKEVQKTGSELAVVASFRWLIPGEILNLFQKGVLNVHPSLLPKYRGATPGQSAILNGDKKTGISIIKLDQEMDHGPILWQKEEGIKEDDTAKSLYLRLFKIASEVIVDIAKKYIDGALVPIPQEEEKASYVKTVKRDSGYIDLNNPPSQETIKRMIRAYYPWPGAWTIADLNNKKLRIKLLPNKMLQIEGKKPASFKDFINGYSEGKNILLKLNLSS